MEEEILKGKTLLVVDDEIDLRDIIANELEFMGAKVFQAENIGTALRVLSEELIDLIISDIRMPGGTGIDLLDSVKAKDTNFPPIILITGFADITLEAAFDRGAEALLSKPFKLDDLIKLVLRYTSPLELRFQEKVETPKLIIPNLESMKICFGRGGASFPIGPSSIKVYVSESVCFDFNLNGDHYHGSGVCRWARSLDQNEKGTLLGVEFLNLEDKSLASFLKNFKGENIVPYIPSQKT